VLGKKVFNSEGLMEFEGVVILKRGISRGVKKV